MANKEATLTLKVKDEGSKQAIGGIQGMLLNLNNAIGIARTVWSGLKGVVDSILGSWGEQEQAINALNQSLVQQGIYSADLSKKYIDMASALQRVSVYGDEQIVQAQAIIQAQLGQQEITESLMKATLDFASAKKIDLASAADNDIAQLMENIEEVLRRNDTLNGTVLSQMSTDVTYHDYARSEEEHYKVGIIDVTVRQLY